MSVLKYAIAGAALAFASQGASASTFLDYQGLAAFGNASVSGPGAGGSYNGRAGSFKMHDASNGLGLGEDFIAFCVDLAGGVRDDNFHINNEAPFDPGRKLSDFQKANVENLFQASYADVDVNDNIQAAAFQLALWEAAYETNEALDLSLDDGNRFGNSSDAAIKSKADEYLASLASWDGTKIFEVNFLDAERNSTQDLVTAQLAPVPVPAAGLLLIGGFGALAAVKRRKEKRAA